MEPDCVKFSIYIDWTRTFGHVIDLGCGLARTPTIIHTIFTLLFPLCILAWLLSQLHPGLSETGWSASPYLKVILSYPRNPTADTLSYTISHNVRPTLQALLPCALHSTILKLLSSPINGTILETTFALDNTPNNSNGGTGIGKYFSDEQSFFEASDIYCTINSIDFCKHQRLLCRHCILLVCPDEEELSTSVSLSRPSYGGGGM